MTDPRNAAPDDHPGDRQGGGVAGGDARRDQADQPDDRGDQVEARRELGRLGVDAPRAGGRCRSSRSTRALRASTRSRSPATPALPALDRDDERHQPVASTTPALATSRTGTGSP